MWIRLAAHSTTHNRAAGHHHAGSPVRLQGGHRACEVVHEVDYDRSWRTVSNDDGIFDEYDVSLRSQNSTLHVLVAGPDVG